MELKLSDETLIGLKRLCNPALVNSEKFQRLVDDCSNAIVENTAYLKNESNDQKADILKTSYAALLILLTEAARQDADGFRLKTMLEGYSLDADRIAYIVATHNRKKIGLQNRLLTVGTNLPHIVDIRWRLDYRVKSDLSDDAEFTPYILVELITVNSLNSTETVRFVCNTQNLQELVFSLKGAARHITKLVNPSK